MKKFFIAVLMTVSMAGSVFAAEGTTSNSVANSNFKSQFKNAADVTWSSAGDYSKVSFIANDVRTEAYYNNQGNMIGMAKGVSLESLPVSAKRLFAKKYDGYTVKEAIHFEGNDEEAYFIAAEKDQQSIILKISSDNQLTVIKSK